MRVEVYWNLHKSCFSVRSCKTGKVIDHTDYVCIRDAAFVVQPAGNKRVKKEGKKNVHAFVRGQHTTDEGVDNLPNTAYYNPYHMSTFINQHGTAIKNASYVCMDIHEGKPRVRYV